MYSYAHLYSGVYCQLKAAEEKGPGSFYSILSAMLLSAFSVEAYLNHLGPILFDHWDDQVKIGTNIGSKLRLIASRVGLPLDEVRRLEIAMRPLNRFRNDVAHAKTEGGAFEASISSKGHVQTPGASWERACTLGTAKRFKQAAADVIETLHRAAGQPEPALGITGEAEWFEVP